MERNNGQYHVLVIIADGQVLPIHVSLLVSFRDMIYFSLILFFISEIYSFYRLPEIQAHHMESLVHRNKQLLIPLLLQGKAISFATALGICL